MLMMTIFETIAEAADYLVLAHQPYPNAVDHAFFVNNIQHYLTNIYQVQSQLLQYKVYSMLLVLGCTKNLVMEIIYAQTNQGIVEV